jgi:uncharacterized protein involved in exopolysaccharide biosynthesis
MNTLKTWSLGDYLGIVYRFKWRVLGVMAGAVLLAAIWLKYTPRQYESHAKLFVRVGRENAALDPTLRPSETISLNASREAEMNSIVEHLRSRSILEQVLTVVAPELADASPEERESTLGGLKRSLYVSSPRASTVVTVQGTATEPHKAQQMVAALVDVYLDEHMRINRATGSHEFFQEQTDLFKDQLESAQAALRDAKNRAGMASIEGRRTALEQQVSALESQVHQVEAALAGSEAKIRALQTAGDSLPEPLLRQMVAGTPNDGLATMRQQLFELRIREQEVLSKYTEAHPTTITIRRQVREVEDALKAKEPDRGQLVSAMSAPEMAHRASLAVQKEKLQIQLDELNGKLLALNEDEIVIEERARNVNQLEAKYLAYVANLEEARMDQALRADRISNVSIIQPATFEPRPVRPSKAMTLLLALLGGAVGGVLVAFLSEQWDPSNKPNRAAAATPVVPAPPEHVERVPASLYERMPADSHGNGNSNGNGAHLRGKGPQ